MPDPGPLKPYDGSKFGCLSILGWVLVAAALTTVLTLLLIWRTGAEVTQEARRIAESLAADFDKTFNFTPQIRVDSIVVVAGNTPVLELVTAQRQMLVRNRWTHTWLHSTKNFELEATFTAKAGFDLTEPFRIAIDPRTGSISAELPSPKLLSLGMSDVRVIQDEDGLWNKLTAEDREMAFRALEGKARETIAGSSLLPEARLEAEKQIRELIKRASSATSVSTPPAKPLP
ncbi:MAG TPA: DUF4230 domain-containing protein [Terrimicrobiaceae bacterium]